MEAARQRVRRRLNNRSLFQFIADERTGSREGEKERKPKTVEELAEILGVPKATLERWMLPHIRCRYYVASDDIELTDTMEHAARVTRKARNGKPLFEWIAEMIPLYTRKRLAERMRIGEFCLNRWMREYITREYYVVP
jgi:hypothetical protein